jgi:hypothetical protein
MLRCGLGYREFSGIYKRSFLEAGYALSLERRSGSSTKAIALMTGLSRRDIQRYCGYLTEESQGVDLARSPAARVLQEWFTATEFTYDDKSPRVLQVDSKDCDSFESLVKRSAVGVPSGALLSVLVESGAVTEKPGGRLEAVLRYYVPGDLDERILEGLRFGAFNMIMAIEANTNVRSPLPRRFQREVHSARIPIESVASVRAHLEESIGRLSIDLDDFLIRKRAVVIEHDSSEPKFNLGVGLYYVDEKITKHDRR